LLAAALAFYAIFVARTAFRLDGRVAFTLFDDAMISMTYARNLARGHGLVWNAGGPAVEGITNPLWAVYMAVPHLLGVPEELAPLFVIVTGAALLLGCACCAHALVRRLEPDRPRAAVAAAWLVAFCYPLVYWTLRGMEVGLITFLVLAGALLAVRFRDERSPGDVVRLALVCVVGVSTRLDFSVYVVVFVAYLVRVDRAAAARAGGATAVALALQEIWRIATYGDVVPNTYRLKLEGVPVLARIERGAYGVLYLVVTTVAVALVCAAVAAWRRRREHGVVLLVILAGASTTYSVWVGGDAWEWMRYANRYLTPAVVLTSCLAAIGTWDLAERLRRRPRAGVALCGVAGVLVVVVAPDLLPGTGLLFPRGMPTGVAGAAIVPVIFAFAPLRAALASLTAPVPSTRYLAVALAVAVGASVSLPPMLHWVGHGPVQAGEDAAFTRYGRALGAVTTEDASIAVVVAGAPIYYSDREGIDLLGKSDPDVARLPLREGVGFWPGHSKWDHALTVRAHRPDVIAQLRMPTEEELRALEEFGYLEAELAPALVRRFGITPRLYARRGSAHVRWEALVPVEGRPQQCTTAVLPRDAARTCVRNQSAGRLP
jgi:hypothetical protein